MDRTIVYAGAIPLEVDILNTNKNSMVGLSKLSAAILGTTTLVNGFTCIPTGPASLQVQVTAGEIYSLQNTDSTAYSTLAADTVNQLIKQGIQLGTVTLSAPAPATGGQSINYLVQVTYQDSDALPVVLPYYNASNPSQAYSGPANAGTTNNTVRKGLATVGIKTGISAATGSQVTPTVDAGYTALFVVSVANGQTQITAPNIATSGLAPFISETLTQKISQTTGDARYVQSANIQNNLLSYFVAAGSADALTGTLASTLTTLVDGMEFLGKASAANATTTPTLNLTLGSTATGVKTIVKGSNQPLATGDIAGAGYPCVFVWNSGYNAWVLINPANGIASTSGLQGLVKNLKADAIGISNYSCVITADEVVLENSSNFYLTTRSVNKTINANGTVGAPLSITSARAASTWYYRWLWYNAGNGLTATLDASSTAPTAPTGYLSTDYKALLPGACRTDASGSTFLLQTTTRGKRTQYVVLTGSNIAALPIMASGVAGNPATPTWVAVPVAAFVPPTTGSILAILQCPTSGLQAIAAPNNSYGVVGSTTNPPPLSSGNSGSIITYTASGASMVLESTNLYWASNAAGASLTCLSWDDNI